MGRHASLISLFLLLLLCHAPSYAEVPIVDAQWTFKLTQSDSTNSLWTTPVTYRVIQTDAVPTSTGSTINFYAARNEYEPVQIVIRPASATSATITLGANSLGANVSVSLQYVKTFSACGTRCTGNIANWLSAPIASGGSIPLTAGKNNVLWITAKVGSAAVAGTATANAVLLIGGTTYTIPLALYVFNFAIPVAPTYVTYMDLITETVGGSAGVDYAKDMLFDLRWSITNPSAPSGFGYGISWDSTDPRAASLKCNTFIDESTFESPAFQAKALGEKYILGRGWDRGGFANAMQLLKFQNNANARPTSFCGLSRGDEFSNAAYNKEWADFLSAANAYFSDPAHDYTQKGVYYVQNEPQNDAAYQVSAFLCNMTRTYAPKLKISISREPLPNIAERTDYKFVPGDFGPCGYDYWIAPVTRWYATYAWQRIQQNNENVMIYSLPQDTLPNFSPCADDNGLVQGVHVRVIPWVSWSIRAVGWAYYNMIIHFDTSQDPPVPGVSAVLFRESFEDWEYLMLANKRNANPRPYVEEAADRSARSVGFCNFAWTQSVATIHTIKRELGYYIEGTRASLPTAQYKVHAFSDGPFYIDFCDPSDPQIPTPLVDTSMGGHTWTKVGWSAFDPALGYGWCGRYSGGYEPTIDLYRVSGNGGDWVQRTYIYDDYQNLLNDFHFSIQNGFYNVTVGVGVFGATRSDKSYVEVNGQPLLARPSELVSSLTVRSIGVLVTDGFIRVSWGPYPPTLCGTACDYTMINFLIIQPDGNAATTSAAVVSSVASTAASSTTAGATVAATSAAASTSAVTSTAFAAAGAAGTSTAAATTNAATTAALAATASQASTAVVTSTAFATGGPTGTATAATTTTAAAAGITTGSAGSAQTSGGGGGKGGLSGGAVAGIVIAVLVLVAIGAVVVYFLLFRRKADNAPAAPKQPAPKSDKYNITV